MDAKFLKDVQSKGWAVQAVNPDGVIVKCPSAGCNLFAELKYDAHVPAVDPGRRRDATDVQVATYEDIRLQLRAARESLLLTIKEVEEIAGIEPDLLAKVERNGTKKIPNVQTLSDWAGALGYEIVLRPVPLTNYALRTIIETRDKSASRTKRMTLESRRRAEKLRRGS